MAAVAPSLLKPEAYELPPEALVFGQTPHMLELRNKLGRVAKANVPVLITGESGTGKEVFSRILHRDSPWHAGPFVKINCPAIPGTLLESELFGYERGAFTGAYGAKPGRVEMADRGTLFLDEIGELDLGLQSKLLQLLQEGKFCRIGANEEKCIEVRVVCATNRDLAAEVEKGNFRQDLYYRINVINLRLPSLAQRRQDIPALIDYFMAEFSKRYQRDVPTLSKAMLKTLTAYHWPGNIREMENVLKQYVIFGTESLIASVLRPPPQPSFSFDPTGGAVSLKALSQQALKKFEREIILETLEANQWNRKQTAKALQISYRWLLYKLKEIGIRPRSCPAQAGDLQEEIEE